MTTPCKISLTMTRLFHAGEFFAPSAPTVPDPEDLEDGEFFEDFSESPLDPKESELTGLGLFSHEEDGSLRISYEDSEITGLGGHLTTFCLAPTGMLILLRRGQQKLCMVFEEEHRHVCDYNFPEDSPTVVLHTHSLQSTLTGQGGKIFVDYSIEINGTRTEHNLLTLSVTLLPL